jgi:hypothetical protein
MRLYHIMDLQGLGFHHVHQGFLLYVKTANKMGQDNFPEQVEKIFVLNAPWLFQTVLNFVKTTISAATLAKLTIIKDLNSEIDQLKEHFDDETIEKINQLCMKDFGQKSLSDCSSISVPARSKFRVYLPLPPHEAKEEFIALTAECTIEKKNIAINLIGRTEDNIDETPLESDILLESYLLSSSNTLAIRNFSIPNPYVSILIEFDNSKSLLTSKQVNYKTTFAIQKFFEHEKEQKDNL